MNQLTPLQPKLSKGLFITSITFFITNILLFTLEILQLLTVSEYIHLGYFFALNILFIVLTYIYNSTPSSPLTYLSNISPFVFVIIFAGVTLSALSQFDIIINHSVEWAMCCATLGIYAALSAIAKQGRETKTTEEKNVERKTITKEIKKQIKNKNKSKKDIHPKHLEIYNKNKLFKRFFILTIILFILVKLTVLFGYQGSYIDEYNHIFTGTEIFNTAQLAMLAENGSYTRGMYVSYITGLLMAIFGTTLTVAKIVPALIGTANFFLVYAISKKILTRRWAIIVLLLIYTFSPWIIFNHNYIRVYIFLEFFILLATYLSFKTLEFLREENLLKTTLSAVSSGILLLIAFATDYDWGQYIVLFVTGIMYLYMYFFESHHLKISFKNESLQKIKEFLLDDTATKVALTACAALVVAIIMEIPAKIAFMSTQTLTHTSSPDFKYDYLFFEINLALTVLFIISIILILLFTKDFAVKAYALIFGTLFFLHMNSPIDLQLLRAVIYLFPHFYIISMAALETLSVRKLYAIVLIPLVGLTVFANYPDNVLEEGFRVPSEVKYMDYQKAYQFVEQQCSGATVLANHHGPNIGLFYTDKIDYTIYLPDIRSNRLYEYNPRTNGYQTFYGQIPVLRSEDIFSNAEQICIVMAPNIADSWRYVTKKRYNEMNGEETSYHIETFKGINVYMNFEPKKT